jgi:drug/metabolite transporter (DMT)-like permease
MLWFALALAGALCQATYGFSVKVLQRRILPFPLAGFSFLTASVMLLCISVLYGIPYLGPGLPAAIGATVIINIVATILFYRALAITDLSLCIPMLAFTPVFLILTSFVILGEIPSPAGAAGILLVTAGAWLLTLEYRDGRPVSLIGPLRTLRSERGVQAMLVVAFLYSISVNYDKEVVKNSDPIFGSAIVFLLIGLAFIALSGVFRDRKKVASHNRRSSLTATPSGPDISPYLAAPAGPASSPQQTAEALFPELPVLPSLLVYPAIGTLLTMEAIFINTAYTMTIVPYVITVKRLSIFFSVLFGGLLLVESQFRERMLGAGVMIAGAVVIGLWG